jgi:hypothetical protein
MSLRNGVIELVSVVIASHPREVEKRIVTRKAVMMPNNDREADKESVTQCPSSKVVLYNSSPTRCHDVADGKKKKRAMKKRRRSEEEAIEKNDL